MSNQDNTLDDLILTDPEPEKGKSKSLLALLALVIVLIIVGAILAKMIFSEPSDSDKIKDNTKVEVTSKSLDLNSDDSNMSNELAPISDDPDLAPIDENTKDSTNKVDTINIDEEKNGNKNDSKLLDSNEPKTDNKTADNLGVAPLGSSTNNADIDEEPKKVKKKIKTKTHTKQKLKKHTYGGTGNVYIQVGSFTKGPENSFIRKIRKAGFKYRIKESNGYRRVYVGPFKNRQEASNILGIVKSKISPNAFVK